MLEKLWKYAIYFPFFIFCDTCFFASLIWSDIGINLFAANSPEPPEEQKVHPLSERVPSLFGQVTSADKASLYTLQPYSDFRYSLRKVMFSYEDIMVAGLFQNPPPMSVSVISCLQRPLKLYKYLFDCPYIHLVLS